MQVIGAELRSRDFRTLINPAGAFVIGGPKGDTGLTGRKIIVDTYGGACPHGGGAYSGKNATKVDRSGAYVARWLAKHVVAAGISPRCTVQLAYAIGVADPVAVNVDLHGHPGADETATAHALRALFDLTPAGIIRDLELDRPIFAATAAFGHFGRNEPGPDHRRKRLRTIGWRRFLRGAGPSPTRGPVRRRGYRMIVAIVASACAHAQPRRRFRTSRRRECSTVVDIDPTAASLRQ
jgi:S-adenosylmethionine synthetase